MKLPSISIDQESIQTFFKTDRGMLVLSMGIALFFWLLIKLSQDYKATRVVNIAYSLPENMSFLRIPPKDIKVTLEGRGWDLMYNYFGSNNLPLQFELANTPLQNISNNQLKGKMAEDLASANISIVDMSFDYIAIELGQSATKKVPITLNKIFSFAPNYQLKSAVELFPDSITLYGPASLLSNITNWSTETLQLDNLLNTMELTTALEASSIPQIRLSHQDIRVRVPVEQFTEKSIFLPVTVKNAPDSLRIFPNKVKISFIVGLSQYDTIKSKDFQLEVDLEKISINQENNTAPVQLSQKPEVVKNIRFSPNSVSFLFVKE
jgi:hypothetical protein